MPKAKFPSIVMQWRAFDRWENRLLKAAARAERRRGLPEPGEEVFLADRWESFSEDMEGLSNRAAEKVLFMRAYLRYISFDGPEFMAIFSSFLELQFPPTCEDAYCLQISQDIGQDVPVGEFFGDWMRIFVGKPLSIDYAAIYSVMPFHDIQITKPKYRPWTPKQIESAVKGIKLDLAADGLDCRIRADGKSKTHLNLSFKWL